MQPAGYGGVPQQQMQPAGFGFGGKPATPQQQSISSFVGGARGAQATQGATAPSAGAIMPIAGLSPYTNGRWRIKARVTLKSDIRKFNNARGEGQLFKIDLIDKAGSEISGTFFGRAVDRFFEMLRPQQVYYFSRGSVKMANKRFDKGEHVITFDENTSVDLAEEDQEIPGVNYNFVSIAEIDRLETGVLIDVKAVILEAREPMMITLRKDNAERAKRELVLWDDSGLDGSSFLELTIWGQNAHDNFEAGAVIMAKGMRVSEWNGNKSLNGGSGYELNPDNPQAFDLKRKFEEKRPNQAIGGAKRSNIGSGNRETCEEIRDADMHLGPAMQAGEAYNTAPGAPRSVHRHFVLATLTNMPSDRPPYYQACPEMVDRPAPAGAQPGAEPQKRQCNRKMTQSGDSWQCQSGHCHQKPVARYLANRVQVVDHTGSLEVSFFDEAGRQIFGCEANEIAELWEDPSRDAELQKRLTQLSWKRFLFRVTSKREMWQDEQRVRLNCEEGAAPNFVKEGNRLLAEVKAAMLAPPEPAVVGAGGA
jgi:replication factor A1